MFISFAIAVPIAIAAITMIALLGAASWYRNRDRRRSPLTTEMVRQPAQALRARVDELNDDISAYVAVALMSPTMAAAMYFADNWHRQLSFGESRWLFYSLLGMAITSFCVVAAIRVGNRRRKLLQAIDAELAVAQELEVLRAHGGRIFHDLQCGDFNIDHVVVGPGGVYAVETKSRLKPEAGSGKDSVKVQYDGKVLRFPGWTETAPLEQTERQARWLAQKLSKATGDTVRVRGVLALPGWFVDLRANGEISVTNPKKPEWMIRPKGDNRLDPAQIQRIAYQLEQMSLVAPGSTAR